MSDSPPNEWEPPVDPLLRTNQGPPAPGRGRHSGPSTSKRRHPARGARALALAASVTATVGIAGAMARADAQSDGTAVEGADSSPDSAVDSSPTTTSPTSEPSAPGSAEPARAEQTSSDLDRSTEDISEDGSQLHRRQGGGRRSRIDTTTDTGESSEAQTEASTPEPVPETIDSLPEEPVVDSPSNPSGWADGVWVGTAEYTEWGDVQVEATISDGRLVDVAVLQVPSDRKSTNINDNAVPILEAQAIELQGADLDIVSGATYTSRTYGDSLQAALDQAALAQGG